MMKNYFLSVVLIISTFNCFAQEKFSFVGYFGLCDLRFIHPKLLVYPGDQYKPNYSFKAGLYYDLLNTKMPKLYPTFGLTVTGKYPLNYMMANSVPPLVFRDKFITMDLPIALNYQISNWLKLKGGINGSALVMGLNHGGTDRHIFTYGSLLGISMRYQKYSFNIEYIREANDMLNLFFDEEASYRSSVLLFGIGYHFNSLKKVKGLLR